MQHVCARRTFLKISAASFGAFALAACGAGTQTETGSSERTAVTVSDDMAVTEQAAEAKSAPEVLDDVVSTAERAETLRAELNIQEIYYDEFIHGEKGAEYQKYIVLHDTEGEGSPANIISYWAGNGNLVAAHFVVGQDGSVAQCVPLDNICHHAGFGDTGHNDLYGTTDESRDDKAGTTSIGSWASDYGMNSYSIGIEMVHVSGGTAYTEAQLNTVDKLIAYIDAYYGFESTIIDHKDWRSGNSDTSAEFATYLANYKSARTHTGELFAE